MIDKIVETPASSDDSNEIIRLLKNARINRAKLVNFLKRRYTGRLVQKIASVFDWSNGNLEPDAFYGKLNDFLLHPKETVNDAASHLKIIKRFAFQMLDMNCDKHICETDIFTFIESHKNDNDFFSKCLIFDLQDISSVFKKRNSTIAEKDQALDNRRPGSPKIVNLGNFLDKSKVKKR